MADLTPEPPPIPRSQKWEFDISRFEQIDRQDSPPAHGIVFYGSSSIALWDVSTYFPDLDILNRGFGGSEMEDAARYCRRALTVYQPATVVLYSGDNDVDSGKHPDETIASFHEFAETLHADVPAARLIVISPKPSILRWSKIDLIRNICAQMRTFAARNPDWVDYLDIAPLMLNESGLPRPEFFRADGVHLSAAGYEVWTKALRPLLTDRAKHGSASRMP